MSAPGQRHNCGEPESPSSTRANVNPRPGTTPSSVGDVGVEHWTFGHCAMANPREFTFILAPRDVQARWAPLVTANPFEPLGHGNVQFQAPKNPAEEARKSNSTEDTGQGALHTRTQLSNSIFTDNLIFSQGVWTNLVEDTKEPTVGAVTGRGASHARAQSSDSTITDKSIFAFPGEDTDPRKANVGAAIGQSASDAQSTDSNELDAAVFGTPGSVALPHVQAPLTPQSLLIAATTPRDADRRPQTPSSRPHKRAKLGWEKDLNEQETDFILYLSLQNIQPRAVGVELNRMTQQFTNSRLDIDGIARVMGREVVTRLRSFQESKGMEEEAERIVSELLTRGATRGWNAGPLSRAKDYCNSLTRGKVLSEDRKSRKEEARCRTALAKWRIDRAGVMPRQDGRSAFERTAHQGMMIKAAQNVADPNEESMKRNLLELWEHGTIGGKAIK